MTIESKPSESEQTDSRSLTRRFEPLFERVIVLTGPTASGKTDLALQVAEALPESHAVEIISLDSMAVYWAMDIGTAKPTTAQRDRVTHHLVDIVSADEDFSVAEYLAAAHQCVSEIERRGKRPMFVGGTPMYLKAILRGFDPGPPANEEFRAAVMADVDRFGIEALRKRLQQVDPLSAARIDPGDARRMVRALEFAKQTGTPISHRQTQFEVERSASEGLSFALQTPRVILHDRIQQRVTAMFEQGLIEEVRGLWESTSGLSKTARQGVGYREVIEYLQLSRPTDDDRKHTAEQVLFHTRRLARRQETWFRSFSEIRPVATHDHTDDRTTSRPISGIIEEIVTAICQ